ncbi:S-layer homology domain-containing protein [Cohnella fermenti]|uniref:SLH domain-containing protein n=1 Tax=Cohnella fermenti TaxID=2565925 RepID=A0A4S4BN36_9BACL|nr:S-layer homology domain-containing protein [Cohnella fermenti]THF76233.1 hypothetical protein E6C55_19595 [Cohnella fermenti]
MINATRSRLVQAIKKTFVLLAVICLILSGHTATFAEPYSSAKAEVGSVSGAPGDTVNVEVSFDPQNNYFWKYAVELEYDSNILELVANSPVTSLGTPDSFDVDTDSEGTIYVNSHYALFFEPSPQTLFTIHFRIKESAAPGDSVVSIRDFAYTEDTAPISLESSALTAGSVTVTSTLPTTGSATVTVGSANGVAGENVTVPVVLSESSDGVASYGIRIDFDTNVLEAQSVQGESGDYFSSIINNNSGYVQAAWADASGGDEPLDAGSRLFLLTFTIKEDVASGDSPLTVAEEDLLSFTLTDASAIELEKTLVEGKITVMQSEPTSWTYSIAPIENQTLTALTVGYAAGAEETKTIAVIRTGTGTLTNVTTVLGGTNADDFTVTQPESTTLDDNSSSTLFTVKPKPGLSTGTHKATVTVSADHMTSVSFTVTQTVRTSGTGTGSSVVTSEPEATNEGVDVLVNGKSQSAGTVRTSTRNGQSVTTVIVDSTKLSELLAQEGQMPTITLPFASDQDISIGELDGRMLLEMEQRQAILELKTKNAVYTIPTQLIDLDELRKQFGDNVALEEVKLQIEIAAPTTNADRLIQDAVDRDGLALVASPVEFSIHAFYGDRSIEVSAFDSYVKRRISVPLEVDRGRITTAVVVDSDGTVRHVPTRIVDVDGQVYAEVNSLTNSVYALVWHPLKFEDVTSDWAKEAVNDMGSRLIVTGVEDGLFYPNRDITRAEFAAILVRALGLKSESGQTSFTDVNASAWYNDSVLTLSAYGLINGFEDGTFRPGDKITREQAIAIIAKAMETTGLKERILSGNADSLLRPFADSDQVSTWAISGFADCLQAGVISGRNDNTLAPQASITRAEAAVLVQNLLRESELI